MKKAIAILTALLTISASVQANSRAPTDNAGRQPRTTDHPLAESKVTPLAPPATPPGNPGPDQRNKGRDGVMDRNPLIPDATTPVLGT